jgi:hypothetical protein
MHLRTRPHLSARDKCMHASSRSKFASAEASDFALILSKKEIHTRTTHQVVRIDIDNVA